MYYDLDTLASLSEDLDFQASRVSPDELEVLLRGEIVLVFKNLRGEDDTLVAFKGTPWHSHAKLMLILDEARYVEFDEIDVLNGLRTGDILILERYVNGQLDDRWLAHKNEKLDVQYIQRDEEMRVKRLA